MERTEGNQAVVYPTAPRHWEDFSPAVQDAARLHVLDTVGVALAGSRTEHGRVAMTLARRWGNGPCHLFGEGGGVDPVGAGFANGVAAHSIDFDDGHRYVHPGSAVVAAAWAAAEASGADGRRFLEAVIYGYAASIRLSELAGLTHRDRGYHPTGTCNTAGAAVAAGMLFGLSGSGLADAVNIAVTQAAGLSQYREDGAPTKHLHAGFAARNGVTAALLAAEGLHGAADSIFGRYGFLAVLGHDDAKGLGDLESAIAECYVKPFPSCRRTHTAVQAAIRLSEEIDVNRITEVSVHTYGYACPDWLTDPTPPDGTLRAMLSTPYCVAAALVTGRLGLDEVAAETLQSPSLRVLCQKVRVHESPDYTAQYPAVSQSTVVVHLNDGTNLEASSAIPFGGLGCEREAVLQKFLGLSRPVLGDPGRAEQAMDAILDLEHAADLGSVAALCEPVEARPC